MSISPETLGNLLDRHWGPLVAWVGPCGGAAEDVVQEAFIALAGETIVPHNPPAWLYTTSRNLAINDRLQRQRRQRRHEVVARREEQSIPAWRTSEAAELAEQLSQLPDGPREIVVARIWGGLSFEEIAQATEKSRATVWRHYQTALQLLRESYGASCEIKR